jgi:hypothetical protein
MLRQSAQRWAIPAGPDFRDYAARAAFRSASIRRASAQRK